MENNAANALTTVADLIRWGASRFAAAQLAYGHGCDNPLDEARQLVLHALHLAYDLPDQYLAARVLPEEGAAVVELLERRIRERKPAPYLTGVAWFAGWSFAVDERVLVPRSPIAELIEAEFQPWLEDREPASILDVGTGCGAIAIACALTFPDAEVLATDISEDALAVARANAERHGVTPRLNCLRADLYDGLADRRFDLIVSNPPYVGRDELAVLDPEYRHEPEIAFTGGQDGLDVVEKLLFGAVEHLASDGLLVLEVGHTCLALERRWPDLPIEWAELERGGLGVGVLEAEDLTAWIEHVRAATRDAEEG